MIEEQFAGELRQFALRRSRYAHIQSGLGYEAIGTIGNLFQRDRAFQLGDTDCREIIAHANSGPDDPLALMRNRRLVDEEMNDKPLGDYIPLVTSIILEAFSRPEGADDDGDKVGQQAEVLRPTG
jgi:hypothetical protein